MSGLRSSRAPLGILAAIATALLCASAVLASTTHQDTTFASVVRRGNTIGVQFHPEKSSFAGRAFVNAVIEDLIKCR